MLVSQTSPVGVELFSYVNAFFFPQQICLAASDESEKRSIFFETTSQLLMFIVQTCMKSSA